MALLPPLTKPILALIVSATAETPPASLGGFMRVPKTETRHPKPTCSQCLLLRLVFVDGRLQILILFTLAEKRTGFFERRQLLLGVVELVHVEIQLAEIFMRAPMAGVYLLRLLIMLHRFVKGS